MQLFKSRNRYNLKILNRLNFYSILLRQFKVLDETYIFILSLYLVRSEPLELYFAAASVFKIAELERYWYYSYWQDT